MAYSITTKDGITINNIPDDVAPDSPDLKARVATIRSGGGAAALEPSTTATGLVGAVTRGLAPITAGAAIGAAAGLPLAGIGAVPGAIAGAGAAALTQLVGDPIINLINNALGTKYTLPTDAMEDFLTRVGVAKPRTEAERIVQATAAGASLAGGTVSAARTIQAAAGQSAPVTQRVAGLLATQPALQITSGAAAGAAGQTAEESGAGTAAQIAASLAAGMTPFGVAAIPAARRLTTSRPVTAPPRIEPTLTPEAPAAPPAAAAIPEAPPAAAIPEVPPATPPVTPAAAAAPIEAAAPMTFTATLERTDVSEVLNLARKAAGMGPGSSAAKARLIDMAQVNPEAAAAAQRLNINVPFDVLSDNAQVRSAVGLTRALVAGEAEAAWEATTRAAIQRADDISQQFDAAFISGRPATGATSQKILDSLTNTRDALKANSKVIYDRIDGVDGNGLVPKSTPVSMNNLVQTLQRVITEVGESGLSQQEKKLLEIATQPGVTYGRLLREKNLIGKAQAGLESPYGSMAEGDLKRLYGALAQDQLDNVGTVAGEEVRRELRAANLMTAKRKALEKRIVGAFGKEIDGSVSQKMQSAVTTASKGDAAAFNRLMKVVPEDLQKETVATALAAVTAGKAVGKSGAGEVVFSPSEFTKVYRGLRSNPPVYAQMVKIMGPEWDRASRDLYEISRRISDAQGRIPVTGKANQILGEMAINGLFSKVISSGAAQRVVTGVVGTIPGGGLVAPDIIGYMAGAKGSGVQKAAKLFADPAFQKLAVEAATTGQASTATLRSAATSQPFQIFADQIKLPKELNGRVQFLQSAIQTERQFDQETQ